MTAEQTLNDAQINRDGQGIEFGVFPVGKWSTDNLKAVLRAHVATIYMENGAAEFVVKAGMPLPSFSSYAAAKASMMEVLGNELER